MTFSELIRMAHKGRNLILATMAMMIAAIPAFAIGTVNQAISPIGRDPGTGPDNRVHQLVINWTADAANGTVPVTALSLGAFPAIQGMRLVSVEIKPGTPSPTNNYSVTITDAAGVDLLAGTGLSLSGTTPTSTTISNLPAPVFGGLTFTLTNNAVNSAAGSVFAYFAPLTQTTITTGAPGLTGANTFTGTNTFTGPTLTANLNSVVYIGGAEPQIGASADIGAQINAAYAAAPSTGQKAVLLAQTGGGCYNYTTPIVLNTSGKYFPIEGVQTGNQTGGINQGACLNYTPTTATTAVTIDYTPSTGGGYTGNPALRNIVIANNSCITAGGCGSSATGLILGSANGAHFAMLENVKVSGFSTDISVGTTNGWGLLFVQTSTVYASVGFTSTTSIENIRWHGGAISVNNTGVSCVNNSGFTFESVSFDGNLTNALNNAGCNVTFIAPWFENPVSPNTNTQYITQSTGQFSITGGQMLDDNTTGTVAQHITTTGGFFDIRGLMVFSGGQTVTNLVNNSGGGNGSIDWFTSSPSLDAAVANATCATAYNCYVKRMSGNTSQLTAAVLSLPFAGGGDPSCASLAGVSNLIWNKASTNRVSMCNNGGAVDNVLGANSTDTLANKSFASGGLVPSAAGGTDLGATALPFGNLWLGTAATNNFKLAPTATAAARVISLPDPGVNVNMPYSVSALTFDAIYGTYRVTTDQTITAGASLTNIPGLSWTFPANTALNVKFTCDLLYSQATAAASDSFGFQDVTVAPTNAEAYSRADTSATAFTAGNSDAAGVTTAVTVVTYTPSAAATVFGAHIDGLIEQPSNASTSVFNIMAQFTTNNGTIKRGSSCQVF